jgi:ribosomal protein S18 acetylase RimI-like enzyme
MIERIHNYLRQRYEGYETVAVPPFTIYFAQSDDAVLDSVAIPDHPIRDDVSAALAEIREQFDKRGLSPRVQYMDAYSPSLTRILDENGFEFCSQGEIIVCTPDSHRPVPTMPGLSTIILSQDSDLDAVKQGMVTHKLGFAARDTQLMNTDPELFRKSLVSSRAFVLQLDGEPVTTGMFTAVYDGVTELTGISTVPAFRRRGFGAYLTGNMAQVAFSRQANLIFMAVPEEEDASVYKRVGFRSKAILFTYGMER